MFSKKKKRLLLKENPIIKELQEAKVALDVAYSNFENVIDPDLIDRYIFEVNAVNKRYRYLLKQLKESETSIC